MADGFVARLVRGVWRARCADDWSALAPADHDVIDAQSVSSVQEAHLVAVHALCAAVERYLAAERSEETVDLRLPHSAPLGVVR